MRRSVVIGLVLVGVVAGGLSLALITSPDSAIAIGSTPAMAQDAVVNQAITDSGQTAIKQAIANVAPAVVRVDVTATVTVDNRFSDFSERFRWFFNEPFDNFFDDPFGSEQERQAVGSGTVIEYAGEKLILTNAHVVDSADSILVTDHNGREWTAEVVGSDAQIDIAVLHLNGASNGLISAPLGDADTLEIGDWAIAIGNPLGLPGSHTATLGIISAVGRDIPKPTGVGRYDNLIQTDAAINPGNSGGPLVNAHGEIIGINTAIARQSSSGVAIEGINFAISINAVTDVLDQLVATGRVTRGWLGVYIQDISPSMADTFGVNPGEGILVADIVDGAPADAAGILSGDVIVRVGQTLVGTTDQLIRTVALTPVGTDIDVEIFRRGETHVLTVTVGERPSEAALYGAVEPETDEPETGTSEKFGLTVGPIDSRLAERLGLQSTQGVVIMDVASGGPADWAGLAEGDVIVGVDLQPVESFGDWQRIVSETADDDAPTFTVIRNGRTQFISLGD